MLEVVEVGDEVVESVVISPLVDDQEPVEPEFAVPEHVYNPRSGIVGYGKPRLATAQCMMCLHLRLPYTATLVSKADVRFMWRAGNGRLEKSVHRVCVLSRAFLDHPAAQDAGRLRDSIHFLQDASITEPDASLKNDLLDIADAMGEKLIALSSTASGIGSGV